ncbi:hypothetical protein M3Y94_00228500 [Aphelenchoides besseyi]|nr:hypothetical protein M3Y94_00228500 [Aphelenchoides besseyi]KAI6236461.1 hypothetical protein M3Y95_00160100 [Aphelenchoides besseyi]
MIDFSSAQLCHHRRSWTKVLVFLYCLFTAIQSVVISDTVHVLNGTTITLQCAPAEQLVRTHMAPDFETPQLIRRVDWFHDDAPVAVFQQDALTDRQWWVAGVRYQLKRPFYELRIAPALIEDVGQYRCRIEADEFFVQETLSGTIPVLVMVRPPAPARPQLTASSESSLTITWSQSAGAAHRPVLRYSILINQVDDESLRVVATKGNQTTAVVDSLLPYTRYKLSVRSENHAGTSEFGPEAIFRTLGEAPKSPPTIQMIRNGTIGCVDVAWKSAPLDQVGKPIVGYRIMVHRVGAGAIREWYVKTQRQSLCSLLPAVEYALSIETDNGFGYSPAATTTFRSEDAAPEGPPESVEARPLGCDGITVLWTQPSVTNGQITSYQIYFKKLDTKSPFTLIRLMINKDAQKVFAYNLTKLESSTAYQIQLTASTSKGESDKSAPIQVTTDYGLPQSPQITNITYQCGNEVRVEWISPSEPISYFKVFLESIAHQPRTLNTSKTELLIKNLTPGQKYKLRVSTVLQSRYSNLTLFESEMSKPESFVVNSDTCVLQSSTCTPTNQNCVAIAAPVNVNDSTQSASFLLVAVGILSFMATFCLLLLYFKRRCVWVKKMLKKADKQNGHETVSLVYETSESAKSTSTSVHVSRFEQHWQENSRNDNAGFRRQFEEIEAELEETLEETPDGHRLKNRYMNIGAIERTRIRIHSADGSTDGYINANLIDSCDQQNTYIATQAPLPHTFADFYSMIWQEHCNLIVVITNLVERGKRKCDVYWPTCSKTPLVFGHLQISLTAEMTNANFVHRILNIKSAKSMTPDRVVHQVHLTSWPDHGIPNTTFPLLSFINYCADIQTTGPIVVHCSAGVGRSGSFILIDSMRRKLLTSDSINIYAHLKHIRKQRQRLVQTLDQYVFIWEVVRSLIRHGITRQSVPHFPNYLKFLYHQILPDGRTRLQMQYEEVCRCPHNPTCRRPIGCIKLPGYHRSDEFLVSNWKHECPDLWKEVWDSKCQSVVLFGSDAEVGDFYRTVPLRSKPEITIVAASPSLPVRVTVEKPPPNELVVRRDDSGHILLRMDDEELCVKMIRLKPSELETQTWSEIERIQEQSMQTHRHPIMLIDPSNSAMPFVICALQSIACQLEQERYVDVLLFLAVYRLESCGCWQAQSNIEYVYEKVLELIQLHCS